MELWFKTQVFLSAVSLTSSPGPDQQESTNKRCRYGVPGHAIRSAFERAGRTERQTHQPSDRSLVSSGSNINARASEGSVQTMACPVPSAQCACNACLRGRKKQVKPDFRRLGAARIFPDMECSAMLRGLPSALAQEQGLRSQCMRHRCLRRYAPGRRRSGPVRWFRARQ